MADDYSNWTAQPVAQDYSGWTAQPVSAPPPQPVPQQSVWQALKDGAESAAARGLTLGATSDPKEAGQYVRAAVGGLTLDRAPDVLAKMDPEHADEYRQEYAQAAKDHPIVHGGATLGVPIPGMGSLKAVKGLGGFALRELANTGIGAGLGLASGGTDMSPTKRALIGAGAGLVGGTLSEGLGALGTVAANKLRAATADQALLTNAARQKALRSARSALGGETSAAFNELERARGIAAGHFSGYTPEQQQAAAQWLDSDEARELARNAADNLLAAGPARMTGSMQTARNLLEQARAGATPEAVDAAASEAMAKPFSTQVVPRLKHIANRALPIALAHAIGGGAPTEMAAAAAMGHPGTTLSNMMKSPAVRAMVYGPISKLAPRASAATSRALPTLVEQLEPSSAPFVPAFADDDSIEKQKAVAQVLRQRNGATQ